MNACPQCNTKLSPNAKFCGKCSYVLKQAPPQKCLTCGNSNDANAKKCNYCGELLGAKPPAVEPDANPVSPQRPSRGDGYIPTETINRQAVAAGRVTTAIDAPVASDGAPPAASRQAGSTGTRPKAGAVTTVISAPGQTESQVQERKVIGILVTYNWKAAGQLFPIREGRNRIGRDSNECEISISEDQAMSSKHAFLIYDAHEQVAFLSDEGSQNGTFFNGQNIRRNEKRLSNYCNIRTGTTNWTFVLISPETSQQNLAELEN